MNTNLQANSEPLVTIGLPTYNRPDGLQKCLEYICKQTYTNLEIIISDNCSTDERVQQIIKAFTLKDSRIRALRQPVNAGLEENFNIVFANATANYFIWMSDDDYFDDNYVAACVQFLEKNPDHVLCSGVARYYADDKFIFTEKMFLTDQRTAFGRMYHYFSKVNKNGNFYGVFRNRLLLEKPIGLHIGCDWSFMAKLAVLGKLGYVETTCYHRSADGNSGTKSKMIKKFGFNKWKSIFFETYAAYYVAANIFNDRTVKNKFNLLQKKLIEGVIFFQMNIKSVVQFINKKRGKNYFKA